MSIDMYKIWCVTDSKYECVISDAVPTECPTNAGHTIQSPTVIEYDVAVNSGCVKKLTLANYKQLRYNEIDYKTGTLIAPGFTFDGATFSLSSIAQMNWTNLLNMQSLFTWPLDISTKDNGEYSLAEADLNDFIDAGRSTIYTHLSSGRDLKVSVKDAVDEAAVDAVVDTR